MWDLREHQDLLDNQAHQDLKDKQDLGVNLDLQGH
jgi:hypothetical protein